MPATRVYLPASSAAPAITPTVGTGWTATATTGFVRVQGAPAKTSTAFADHASATPSATNPSTAVMRQYIFGPLAAQTVSGTLTGVIRGLESNANFNATVALGVRQVDSAGAHVADLLAVSASDNTAAAPPEFTTSALTRRFQDVAEATSLTLTSRTFTAGQYLVIEIGYRKASTSTAFLTTLRFGDSAATDFAHSDGLTTDLNPWVEFSGTITLAPPATRWIGSEGVNVDIKAGQAQIGQTGVNADIIPQVIERQTGAQWLTVDYAYPEGVQSGQLGATVDLATQNAVLTGGLGIMVDYVEGLAVAGIGWDGTQFVASGATPVLWGADVFQTAGGYPSVTWEDDHFEAEP